MSFFFAFNTHRLYLYWFTKAIVAVTVKRIRISKSAIYFSYCTKCVLLGTHNYRLCIFIVTQSSTSDLSIQFLNYFQWKL